MKIAIVGCGKIADAHVEQIQRLASHPTARRHGARVVAACDREPLMAEQLADRYGVDGWYTDYDRMLDAAKPDVVHITTPPPSHLALAARALEAGAHVYCEKPVTLSTADTERLLAAAEAAGRKLTVGYTYMFDPPARDMRALIEGGVLGDIIHAESFYGYNLAGPFGATIMAEADHWVHRLPGGLLHNNIDHLLCKLVELSDAPWTLEHAWGARLRPARFGDARDRTMDELRVMIRSGDVSGYATFSSHVRPVAHTCMVYGSKNCVHVDYETRAVTLTTSSRLPSAIGRLVPTFERAARLAGEGLRQVKAFARSEYHFFAGLEHLIAAFYDSIADDGPVPIPYSLILRTGALMDAIFAELHP